MIGGSTFSRRGMLGLFAGLVGLAAAGPGRADDARRPPNVVLIVADE